MLQTPHGMVPDPVPTHTQDTTTGLAATGVVTIDATTGTEDYSTEKDKENIE